MPSTPISGRVSGVLEITPRDSVAICAFLVIKDGYVSHAALKSIFKGRLLTFPWQRAVLCNANSLRLMVVISGKIGESREDSPIM